MFITRSRRSLRIIPYHSVLNVRPFRGFMNCFVALSLNGEG